MHAKKKLVCSGYLYELIGKMCSQVHVGFWVVKITAVLWSLLTASKAISPSALNFNCWKFNVHAQIKGSRILCLLRVKMVLQEWFSPPVYTPSLWFCVLYVPVGLPSPYL